MDDEFKWFVIGFAASREGFNGECPCDHLAPSNIFRPSARPLYASLEEMLADERLRQTLHHLYSEYKRKTT